MQVKEATWLFWARSLAAAAGAALAITTLAGVLWFWTGPRVTEWAQTQLGMNKVAETLTAIQQVQREQQGTIATISQTQAQTAETLNAVVNRIASLEKSQRDDRLPPIKFVDDSLTVTSGKIGDFVRFEFQFTKSRDCGRPQSVAYFKDGADISHAFTDKSTDAADGRSVSSPISAAQQTARFIAKIPKDQGVVPTGQGQWARAYVMIAWPDCPNVPPLRSPLAPFQIFD